MSLILKLARVLANDNIQNRIWLYRNKTVIFD